ncbi:pyridoxamine kinase [Streptococcus gallolyticus]|nr:pyridoxamine kinase [Streptococcus gallolyticus]MBY5041646.1 pyridoxamine kinase [Streptococcus gallolyticus]
MPKRLLLANDLPGIGKVALAASMPILAACQVETAILPTVLLSSHTGGFTNIALADMSQLLVDYLAQWQSLKLHVDGLLIGYSRRASLFERLEKYATDEKIPIILDPILGDNGKLYSGFDQNDVLAMRQLAGQAKVLIPNLTEAAFLTDSPYLGNEYGRSEIEQLLVKLADFGAEQIVLTGISFDEEQIGLAHYDVKADKVSYHMTQRFPQHFFGTGDMVASLVAALYVEKIDFDRGLPQILQFVEKSLQETVDLARDVKYGVYFEPHLAELSQVFEEFRRENEK